MANSEHRGDKVALTGRNEILASVENLLSMYEIDDPDLLDIPVVTVDHMLAWRVTHRNPSK